MDRSQTSLGCCPGQLPTDGFAVSARVACRFSFIVRPAPYALLLGVRLGEPYSAQAYVYVAYQRPHTSTRSPEATRRAFNNPGGSPEATRRAFNKRFLLDLAEDWQQHGREVFKRVRRESPAAYLKVCAMLVPREMKLEHSGGVKAMTDDAIVAAIAAIEEMLAQRQAGANAKVIEGEAEVVPSLPRPETAAPRCPRPKVSLSKSP